MLAPPTLETERLILRPHRADDAVVRHRLWTERDDPRVPAHRRIGPDGRPTVEDLAERAGDKPGLLTIERKQVGDAIGYCGLIYEGSGAPGEPEIAYELLRSAHGHGYATEAARAVVGWATELGHPRVWATVRVWNTASLRVLDKLGFRETGEVERDAVHGDSLLVMLELE